MKDNFKAQQNINSVPITTKEYTMPLPNKLINSSQEQIIKNIIDNIDLPKPTPMLANYYYQEEGKVKTGTTTVFKWRDKE